MKYREDSSEGGEIAVVGYAARLPGAENVEAFWDVLSSETCTVSEVPEDRWSSVRFLDPSGPSSGKSYTLH